MSFLETLVPVMVLATVPVAAVPPPPEQVAANCETPTYASDTLVCDDPVLRSLDARMRETLAAADLESVVAPAAWVEPQDAWFRRRSLCAFSERQADCLRAAYVERIAVLEAVGRVARRPLRRGMEVSCPEAPWGQPRVRMRAPESGALVVENDLAHVLATATPAEPDGVWSPFVRYEVDGSLIRLATLEGAAIVCTSILPR